MKDILYNNFIIAVMIKEISIYLKPLDI